MNCDQSTYCKCLYYAANALSRNITKIAEDSFASVDLAPSYAFIVMTVNKNPGVNAGELAKIMMLKPSTITRLVEKLEKSSLIKRFHEGKQVLIFPTKTSMELDSKIKEAWAGMYNKYVDLLGKEFADKLTQDVFKAANLLE